MDRPFIYLDNAATSFPKPEAVLKAVDHALRVVGGSPGRSGHRLAINADKIIFEARENICRLLGIADSSRLIFTSGATESLNLAIKGILESGDHVVISSMEHSSVTRPLHSLSQKAVEVTKVKCDKKGLLAPDDITKAIKKNTRLIVLTHASNVTGTIQPVCEVGKIARERGITFLVDACQTAGVFPIDLESIPVDMLAASGHKGLLGPQGTGILYIRPGINLSPLKEGGTGRGPSDDKQPEALPDRFEAGTMNTPGIAGLGAAAAFLLEQTVEAVRQKEMLLYKQLLEGLIAIEGVTTYGSSDPGKKVSLLSFNIEGLDPSLVSFRLDEEFDILSRSGLHCAPDAHKTVGTFPEGAVRLSPGFYNIPGDIDKTIAAIHRIAKER
ncbi:MAG: aminotransferase class V-fold PLP-dependent enzyme [Proteobacteria bacterium]|nr:aminotransferase class V-fold PLP-dependent enzyme [Pseudomonadota bacterium]